MSSSFPRLTRRRFLTASAAAVCGVGVYTWRIEPHWVEVVERDLPIANLPAALDGETLVQLSDLHVGPIVDPDYLTQALAFTSSLNPALTVITGDFMTCNGMEQIEPMTRVMERLRPGRLGAYAILGNHDYSKHYNRPQVAERLTKRLGDLGVTVLRDQCCTVAGLQLVGLDDLLGSEFKPEAVLASVAWERATLTLCHNPDAVDLPAMASCKGWILAGHTHGGQCKLPFMDPPLLPIRNRRYVAGEFDLGNGRRLYVNRGLGYLYRVRFNVRPEITVWRMKRAEA